MLFFKRQHFVLAALQRYSLVILMMAGIVYILAITKGSRTGSSSILAPKFNAHQFLSLPANNQIFPIIATEGGPGEALTPINERLSGVPSPFPV